MLARIATAVGVLAVMAARAGAATVAASPAAATAAAGRAVPVAASPAAATAAPGRAVPVAASPPAAATPSAGAAPADAGVEPAIRAFEAGDYERAVKLLRALAPELAAGAEAQFYLGYSLLRLERWSDALVAVEAALALRPDDLRAVYLRGLLRVQLGQPGAEGDFTRVRDGLPDAPIGRSSADHIVELAAARERAASSATHDTTAAGAATAPARLDATPADGTTAPARLDATPADGTTAPARPDATAADATTAPARLDATAVHPLAPVTPGDLAAPVPVSPWTARLFARLSADVDTNPGLAPEAMSGPDPGIAGTASPRTSPALSLSLRSALTRSFGSDLSATAGLSGFQRLYAPATGAGGGHSQAQAGMGGGHEGGGGGMGGGGSYSGTGSALEAGPGGMGAENDLSELAFDLGADWRPGRLTVAGGYKGDVVLYAFAPFAHEHSLWARVGWPSSSWLSATLRLSAMTLQPLDSSYDQLRGYGGSARPVATLLLLGGDLLLEGGWGVETYRAADRRVTSANTGNPLVYSYSYDGHGPELYASWLGPLQLHVAVWGSASFRTYRDADVWERPTSRGGMMGPPSAWETQSLLRRDTRWLAGARISKGFRDRGELFLEASYLDNRSSLDVPADNRNVRRVLLSVGVQWR
jgi:uncharacterized membrane protein YgcG